MYLIRTGLIVERDSITRGAHVWRSMTVRAAITRSRSAAFHMLDGGCRMSISPTMTSIMPSRTSSLLRTWL
jgi:hypothetical protein